jgi:GNAT superfamily N-acetyltransferase
MGSFRDIYEHWPRRPSERLARLIACYGHRVTSIDIRAYDPARDGAAVYALWQRSLGRAWPLDWSELAAVMGDALVAFGGGRLAGAAAVAHAGRRASLQLLLVDPDLRRQDIGRRLHDAALDQLARLGAQSVSLGGVPGPYLWPGLPADLAEAGALLERWDWTFGHSCWDLVRELADYETPADVARRGSAFTYHWATSADRDRLAAFEALHFREWAAYFDGDALETALVALDDDGAIIGSLMATDQRHPQLWRKLLGEDSGTINAVGVAEAARGRGVGTAMVAYACEQLRDRGVGSCHVGWTTELSFYGRLGFQAWRRYETASHKLAPSPST